MKSILELYAPFRLDKNRFSVNTALDFGLDYYKEGNRFAVANELHSTLGIQKVGILGSDGIQRAMDIFHCLTRVLLFFQ